jgi:hypothetical protein
MFVSVRILHRMSAVKRIKQSRANRDHVDTTDELTKASKANDIEAVLRILDESLGSGSPEEAARRRKALEDRIEAIIKNPAVFFSMEGAFGDEEICAVRTALQGKDWHEFFLLAVEAEKQKFLNLGYSPAQADSLVQPGWAWKYEQTMIAGRDGSSLARLKPDESIEMVFVHEGFRWEPPCTLASLARIELRIPCPVAIGNVRGSYLASRTASIRQTSAFAAFIAKKHPEEHLQMEAQALVEHCNRLLALMEKGGDLDIASAAMNVAYLNAMVRIMAESEMLDANRRQHAFYGNAKPDPTGVRGAVKKALLAVYGRVKRMPRRDEVLKELAPLSSDDGMIHLMQEIVTPERFDKILEGIRRVEKWRWQKGPEVRRGRPRKEN